MPIRRAQPAIEAQRAGTILFMQARSCSAAVRISSGGMLPNQDKVRGESGTGEPPVRILAAVGTTNRNSGCWFTSTFRRPNQTRCSTSSKAPEDRRRMTDAAAPTTVCVCAVECVGPCFYRKSCDRLFRFVRNSDASSSRSQTTWMISPSR